MEALDLVANVINRLIPLIENEVKLHLNSKEAAQLLKFNLQNIKDLLDDAENKQMANPSVKRWLEEVQGLAYDIEDSLDEWEIPGTIASDQHNFRRKVMPSILFLCSCSNQVLKNRLIAQDLQNLNLRVERMYDEAENVLKLQSFVGGLGETQRSANIYRKLEDSVVNESEVHGRNSDKEDLRRVLLSYGGESSQNVARNYKPIIAIVGVGGIGKTTLAKLVFNDTPIKEEFPQRIWVCVSNPFDEIRVAREILEALGRPSLDVIAKETLMTRIKEEIWRKGKFLLVLDDVWTDDVEVWKALKDYLRPGCEGSKIMITTRNYNIAKSINATHIHDLKQLTVEETWSVISKFAFLGRSPVDQSILEGVGRNIAKKCNGLPLAAQFLGKLLQSRQTERDWELVWESKLWEMKNVEDDIFRFFLMSYRELEPAVKRCFSYCGVFPKGHRIDVEKLIRMWIAQGFISSSERGGEMELEGREYFMELAHRGFFQDLRKNVDFIDQVMDCTMHDIVHDFARYLSNSADVVDGTSTASMEVSKCRHLWMQSPQSEPISIFDLAILRTLIFGISTDSALLLLPNLKRIRVLSLAKCHLKRIPDEMGYLLQLRYLDLSGNDVGELPESICNLFNLQTLDLTNCLWLHKLPKKIFKLINLRHLLLDVDKSFSFPQGFGRLVNLRTLSHIEATKHCNHLGYLRDLKELGGDLKISLYGLDSEADVNEATNAALAAKHSLRRLRLYYDDNVGFHVVEALQPPSSLQHLRCEGGIYPSWISSLTHLRKLQLIGTSATETQVSFKFPPLWNLGFLEELEFNCIFRLVYLGREFLGLTVQPHVNRAELVVFPMLRKLSFESCESWGQWEDISEEQGAEAAAGRIKIMPSLRELRIDNCRELKELPHGLFTYLASRAINEADINLNPICIRSDCLDPNLIKRFS